MSKKTVYQAFRWVASKVSGHGLRRRFPFKNTDLQELADTGFSFINIGATSGSGSTTRSSAELLEMYHPTSFGYANLLCVRRDE